MLKLLNPLLGPDLLHALASMGHGDEIAIVDANYPADSNAQRLIRMDGLSATDVLSAVLSIMPLDPPEFVPHSAHVMEVVGAPGTDQPIFGEFQAIVSANEDDRYKLGRLERFAFYERTKQAYAIVITGERRLYGNILLKKGIVRPDS
jgi:L-fucose mutarotase